MKPVTYVFCWISVVWLVFNICFFLTNQIYNNGVNNIGGNNMQTVFRVEEYPDYGWSEKNSTHYFVSSKLAIEHCLKIAKDSVREKSRARHPNQDLLDFTLRSKKKGLIFFIREVEVRS